MSLASRGAVAAALAAATVHAAPAPAPVSASARHLLGIRGSIDRSAAVALTFDDGPHAKGTPAVLERLAEAGARATFFVVGEQVERRRSLVGEIVAAGHEVALHGQSHRGHLRLPPRAVRDDISRGLAVVEAAAGRRPRLHRPPFGLYSAASLAHTRREGLEPVLWSRHGRDWSSRATPELIAARLGSGVRGGEVLLMHDADHYGAHDSWQRTAAALPPLLEALARAGLEAAPA